MFHILTAPIQAWHVAFAFDWKSRSSTVWWRSTEERIQSQAAALWALQTLQTLQTLHALSFGRFFWLCELHSLAHEEIWSQTWTVLKARLRFCGLMWSKRAHESITGYSASNMKTKQHLLDVVMRVHICTVLCCQVAMNRIHDFAQRWQLWHSLGAVIGSVHMHKRQPSLLASLHLSSPMQDFQIHSHRSTASAYQATTSSTAQGGGRSFRIGNL